MPQNYSLGQGGLEPPPIPSNQTRASPRGGSRSGSRQRDRTSQSIDYVESVGFAGGATDGTQMTIDNN